MNSTFVARGQAALYVVSGVWPIVHMRSFETVSGPKADRWLVKTVGALLSLIGLVLWRGGQEPVSPDIALLGVGSALVLASVDVIYAGGGRISKIYLLDAAAETGILAAWLLTRG